MDRTEVAIVGAGPASLAAATTLGDHGIDVTVVDEQQRPGGQIYRRPPTSFRMESDPANGAGRELLEAAASATVRWATSTLVWGVSPNADAGGFTLALADDTGVRRLHTQRLLLAPGAYDLPVPFPGWTLPGVMSVGGVQTLLKSQGLVAGRRLALVGAHPLVLVVAAQLLRAGADVAAVAMAQPRPNPLRLLKSFGASPVARQRLPEAIASMRRLRANRVPFYTGKAIVAAEGTQSVESIRIDAVDGSWRPTGGAPVTIDCDVAAIGYGFVPSIELARHLGCDEAWEPSAGGWVIRHDAWMAASRPGVYVAGEITGVAGAEQAADEGRMAALGILRELGRVTPAAAERRAQRGRRQLRSTRRFNRSMAEHFGPKLEALADLAPDEAIVCRCEEITAGTLREALAAHPHIANLDALKLLTRAGMGPCQGRSCALAVQAIVARERGITMAQAGCFAARPPLKPIRIEQLADAHDALPATQSAPAASADAHALSPMTSSH